MGRYTNPWETGPREYVATGPGVEYAGLTIYRRDSVFDVVANGVAINTRGSLRNCKTWIDESGGYPRPAARGARYTYHENAPGVFNVVTEWAGGYGSPEAIAKLKGDSILQDFTATR